MPYVPPHLRPGYIPSQPVAKPDFTGKVHWPTNKDKDSDILDNPRALSLGKTALKIRKQMKHDNDPILRPSQTLGRSKFNNAVRRHIFKEMGSKKRISRRRSMSHRKKRSTRKKRTV